MGVVRRQMVNDLYSSLNIIWVIKLRRMRWAGHAAHMGERIGTVISALKIISGNKK